MPEKPQLDLSSLPTSSVFHDIPEILDEAFLASLRLTPEYRLGMYEARREQNIKTVPEMKTKMIPFAESFISILKKFFPLLTPTQIRLGFDYNTHGPVALFVFPESSKDKVKDLRDSARALERAFWDLKQTEGMIWVLATDKPDQKSIEKSFPVARSLPF